MARREREREQKQPKRTHPPKVARIGDRLNLAAENYLQNL